MEKEGEKDKLILFELLQDCRQPIAKIAKAVKLPQQTVSYRIAKMEKEKIIKKYTINIDYQKLGLNRHSLYLDLRGIKAKDVDEYLKTITKIDEVSCCYMLHNISRWKLYISVWTKTIGRYDEIQTLIISKFKKHIINYLSFQGFRSYTYLAKRLNPNKKAKVDIKDKMDNIQLKEVDWKIIRELKKNSKMSVLELAHKIKSSFNTIMRRMKFLKNKEIIERFYPIIDIKKMGFTEYTFISRIDPSYEKQIDKFIEMTKKDPRFTIVIKAVGYVNLYYAFLSKNNQEVEEITHEVETLFGRGLLETHKIEVENMIS
ncbi:MAG: winged helix-turn-helix transcriptional regulator [Candidatus Nanoarchaeia archaeon]|nr:winged helix-turn-helix transcriptional regulator [Candidatus Nanoarchaeia archaeon]